MQELLQRHGLLKAYNQKLAGASPSTGGKGVAAPAVSSFSNCFCCGAGSTANAAQAESTVDAGLANSSSAPNKQSKPAGGVWQPRPEGVRPLRTTLSPVALLLLLAYMAATCYYIYVRAVGIQDLGSQWW